MHVEEAEEGRDSNSPEEGEQEQVNSATKREQKGREKKKKHFRCIHILLCLIKYGMFIVILDAKLLCDVMLIIINSI